MSKTCRKCGARCCTYFCFEIDEPDTFEEFDDIRWYLCHEGVTVHVDEGDWYISIENRCKMLTDDYHCTIYRKRPMICRKYSPSKCDYTGDDYGYDEYFETPEQIEEYARDVLGDEQYEKARAKALAKTKAKRRKKSKKE